MENLPKTKLMNSVCKQSKAGLSLTEITETHQLSTKEVLQLFASKSGLSERCVRKLLRMKGEGRTLEQLSQECNIGPNTLKEFLPNTSRDRTQNKSVLIKSPDRRGSTRRKNSSHNKTRPSLQVKRQASLPAVDSGSFPGLTSNLPKYVYTVNFIVNLLHWSKIATGETFHCHLAFLQLRRKSVWCEVPGSRLCFTGGGNTNKVDSLEILKDFACTMLNPMATARDNHAVIFYRDYLYVIGGEGSVPELKDCERLFCKEDRWEHLPSLPRGVMYPSAVVLESTGFLYVTGGHRINLVGLSNYQGLIQRLSLTTLRWSSMVVEFPTFIDRICSFKVDESEIYLGIRTEVYRYSPPSSSINLVKTLWHYFDIYRGPVYYVDDWLFFSSDSSVRNKIMLGRLK